MERIAAEPEVTVRGLMTELAERGVAVSYGTVWNFIHREGMSFKKSVLPAEQDRPDVARRSARWKKYQARLVFTMKPGSRPTWLPSEVGARGAGGSRQRSRTVTGRQ